MTSVSTHTGGARDVRIRTHLPTAKYTGASTWLFLPHHGEGKACSASTRTVVSLAASLCCNINDVSPVGIPTCHCKGGSRRMEKAIKQQIKNKILSLLFPLR